jgi:hypothetical protein
MKRTQTHYFLIGFLLVLPGCGRIIDWGRSNFYQGTDVDAAVAEVAPLIRSVTIYDQLETKAIFDAVWLNDTVRHAYASLHTMRQGKNEEKMQAVLRRQLEENNHFITFYLLSTHEVKLGVPESQWSLFLQVNGKDYYPSELKEIELPYEYQVFFGKRWNRFKVPYVVRFTVPNDEENGTSRDTLTTVKLIVRSAQKEHAFEWLVENNTEFIAPVTLDKEGTGHTTPEAKELV